MRIFRQCYTFYANSTCRRPTSTPWRLPSGPHSVRQLNVLYNGKEIQPFYEVAETPSQIKWLTPLLILNSVVTFAGGMSALFLWTQKVEPQTEEEENLPPRHELRPLEQRGALGFLHMGMGFMVFMMLWRRRRAFVNKMWILPRDIRGTEGFQDTVVIQTYADNPMAEFTCRRDAWKFNPRRSDVVYQVELPGPHFGYFYLLPDRAIIQGKRVSKADAEQILSDPFTYLEKPKTRQVPVIPKTPLGNVRAQGKK